MQKRVSFINVAKLSGVLRAEWSWAFKEMGIDYYENVLMARRTSGYEDLIRVVATETVKEGTREGDFVTLEGIYTSRDVYDEEGKRHSALEVRAEKIYLSETMEFKNHIMLTGNICRKPVLRTTPKGWVIADVLLAVNIGKRSDFIPCIIWSDTANEVGNLPVGTLLSFHGRAQSREYRKIDPKTQEPSIRTAYEVSLTKLEMVGRQPA